MDVIDVAVVVVVGAVAGDLVEVGPDVRRQVRVLQPCAGVDDRDGDAGGVGELPRAGQVEHAAVRDRPLVVLAVVGARGRALALWRRRQAAGQYRLRSDRELMPSWRATSRFIAKPLRSWAGGELERPRADARERALQGAPAQVAEQRPAVAGPQVDAVAAHRVHGLRPQPGLADADAEAGAAQRPRVEVRERLVLREGLEADPDPGALAAAPFAAEPVGVGELAADRFGQPAVDDLLVEPAQLEGGEQAATWR